MKILIADDHQLVRETIAAFLAGEGGFEVHGVEDVDQALKIISKDGPFDLILLDYDMPGMDGLIGFKRIKTASKSPVAILSGTATPTIAQKAIDAGAAGYIPKSSGSKTMVSAAHFMVAGEIYAPYHFLNEAGEDKSNGLLTERERQVLTGICEGKSNKEIAIDYGLQEVTVKLHVKTLSRKLNAKNRTHAAMIARDRDLI